MEERNRGQKKEDGLVHLLISNADTLNFLCRTTEQTSWRQMSSNQTSFFQSKVSSTMSSSLFVDRGKTGFWDRTLNFRTAVGRYFLLVLMISSGFVPAAILLAQNINRVNESVENLNNNLAVNKYVEQALEIRKLVYTLQLERGHSALYVSSDGSERTRKEMLVRRIEVDKVFYGLTIWPHYVTFGPSAASNKSAVMLLLLTFRHGIDMSRVDDYDVITFFSNLNVFLLQWMKTILHSVSLGTFWPYLTAFEELAISTENTGQERARGAIFFSRGYVSADNLQSYLSNVAIGNKSLAEASEFSSLVSQKVRQTKFLNMTKTLNTFRKIVFNNGSGADVSQRDRVETAKQWIAHATAFINALHEVQNELGVRIMTKALAASVTQKAIFINSSVMLVLEFLVYPLFVLLAVRLTNSVNQYSCKLSERMKRLAKEQRRNATLVKEMYPATVAQRLLNGKTVEPDIFDSATVCFSGLADFTEVSRRSHGVDLIFFINRLFDLMDCEMIKHDVFKVETVGDQCVVVSGVPVRNEERHVTEIADMTLGLLEQTAKLTVDHLPNQQIRLKFGVCSGPVVAGIVGLKMPRYCLFGDTVNMASRMQSSSKGLRIHLSSSSGELLARNRSYKVMPRGSIEIKGKGLVETFWLCGKSV